MKMNLFDKQFEPRCEVDKATLKKKVFGQCCLEEYEGKEYNGIYQDEDIDPNCMTAWEAFKQADFDLDRFFIDEYYLLIPDDNLRCHILVECLLLVKPISDYVIEWMAGYLDFGSVDDNDIFKYLYFCRTDEEIWDLLGSGIGNIETLFLRYMGIDTFPVESVCSGKPFQGNKEEEKAKRLIDYILTESACTTEKVRAEILENMECDDLSMYLERKGKGVNRYKQQAEAKTIESFWRGWCWLSTSKDQQIRETAMKYLERAAEMGHYEAQYEYAVCLFWGRDITRDKAEAEKWFSLSAARGNPNAEAALKRIALKAEVKEDEELIDSRFVEIDQLFWENGMPMNIEDYKEGN